MYLGIDIGGTKTFVALLDEHGVIRQQERFPTPPKYADWLIQLADIVANLPTKTFIACGVGVPGRIDRKHGVGLDMGNLTWHHVPVQSDVTKLLGCPVVVENDANLAGLSESMLLKQYRRVLYVTISTGIGTGFIVDQVIEPSFADSEGGKMMLEHNGKVQEWEDFASGRAIVERYGKRAHDITDAATWKQICHNIAIGLIDLIAVVQPDIIVLGGGVGTYYPRYKKYLADALDAYATPLVPIPPIKEAARPEEAVIYGCYDLARSLYGSARS
ncbi:MAG TPA: ROK family protein [Patescibacteria group bacterium]|nr:ROK family protein [Patescibacteria group bacterium]